MSLSTYPSVIQTGVKNVQRGVFASSGTATISIVDPSKTFVRSYSTGSSGTIATNSNESGTLSPTGGSVAATGTGIGGFGTFPSYFGTRTFSGGTTSLYSKEYGVYLASPISLTATGACRWEVIEYY